MKSKLPHWEANKYEVSGFAGGVSLSKVCPEPGTPSPFHYLRYKRAPKGYSWISQKQKIMSPINKRLSAIFSMRKFHEVSAGELPFIQRIQAALWEHVTKCCSHMDTGEFLVKQPVRFEPLAYFHHWRIVREYSTGEWANNSPVQTATE